MNEKYACLQCLTVLYAEDEEDTRKILAMVLEDYVGQLLIAKNGEEAWDIFTNTKIDLVLSDILMPKLDGIGLIKRIRNNVTNSNVPIVITTAFTDTQYLLDAMRLKCDAYIVKPVDLEELLETLYNAILPHLQKKEIELKNSLLATLSAVIGGKKIEIAQYLIEHCDDEQMFYGSHEDIANHLNISRPTVVNFFQQLIDSGLLQKVKNKTYRLCGKTKN